MHGRLQDVNATQAPSTDEAHGPRIGSQFKDPQQSIAEVMKLKVIQISLLTRIPQSPGQVIVGQQPQAGGGDLLCPLFYQQASLTIQNDFSGAILFPSNTGDTEAASFHKDQPKSLTCAWHREYAAGPIGPIQSILVESAMEDDPPGHMIWKFAGHRLQIMPAISISDDPQFSVSQFFDNALPPLDQLLMALVQQSAMKIGNDQH